MGKLGDIMALVGVVFGSSCAYATADASVGETFSGDGLSDTLVGASEGSTTDPDISTGIALVAPSLSITFGSSAEPEIIGIIFRKNAVPYTRMEKKATDLQNIFETESGAVNKKTAFITETKEGYELLNCIIDKDNISKNYDTLLALEKYLTNITS